MSNILSNEEAALYEHLKGIYNDVTNAGILYTHDTLKEIVDHYNSVRGWIGRNSYWILPLVALVSYEVGKYVGRHY